jgi:hypothetical protein
MKRFALSLSVVGALAACSTTAPTGTAGRQSVKLNFAAEVNGQAFACGQQYPAIGTTRSTVTPSDFRYYVSEVQLLTADGKAVPVQLDQDGIWQLENIALLDFENGTGPCRNGTTGREHGRARLGARGRYTGVRFTLGVPFARNHGDPRCRPHR